MGMKIRQESRVKTFFKRLFKLSRKKDKAGGWGHAQLESTKLYSQSSDSDLDILTLNPHLDQSVTVSKEAINKVPEGPTTSNNDLTKTSTKSPSLNKGKKDKLKGKKQGQSYEEDKYILPSDTTPLTTPNTDKKLSKKKEQKKNKKQNKNLVEKDLSEKYNADKSDNDMIDIDLDLVLSSFPSIRKPKYNQIEVPTEADDNIDNHNRQVTSHSAVIHQVEAVIESSPKASPSYNNIHQPDMPDDDKNIEKWETLVIEDQYKVNDGKENSQQKKRKRSKKTKTNSTKNTDGKIRRDNSEKEQNEAQCEEQHIEDEEFWKSSEPLVSGKKQKKNKKAKKSKSLITHDDGDDDNTNVTQPLPTSPAFTKKSKRNKKRGNVRHPEEDMEFELTDNSSKRPKHQVFLEQDIITEIEAPQQEEELSKRKSKKTHRRRLRLKFNKEKKKLDVRQYDELDNREDENLREENKRMGPREVGRRMWKACKRGLKYLRVGLVYYTKAPSAALSPNPIVTRYDDDHSLGSWNTPGTSTSSRYY